MAITRAARDGIAITDIEADDRLAMEAGASVEAFASLYELHVDRVYRYLRARGVGEDEATDLTATTFERAIRHIDRYRPGGAGFAPWLLRIARNASIDAVRRRRHQHLGIDVAEGLVDPGLSPDEAALAADERRWVNDLVATLPDVQRDALALRFAAGLSSREIAVVIGKSEAATKKLLTRTLTTLKEAISHDV